MGKVTKCYMVVGGLWASVTWWWGVSGPALHGGGGSLGQRYMVVGVSGPALRNDFYNVGLSSCQYPTDGSNC